MFREGDGPDRELVRVAGDVCFCERLAGHILKRLEALWGNDMLRSTVFVAVLAASGYSAHAGAQPARDASRGELLYSTHCIACHNVEVHWRARMIANDWASLQAEVRRWQGFSGLGWGDDDVAEVARYLNALHYRFAMPD